MTLVVITTGLYAGFLLTFLIAVMPGLTVLPDDGFTAAMRRFNEKAPARSSCAFQKIWELIINPSALAVLFG
ncbi:hypothetical protein [Streptomyces sp. NBC_00441]|uniref:hypothetical protein n=1 Tax=Streptomyces sp. NBC_00441 TaxID=2975742 RepID=UPI003FCCA499